MGRSDLGQRIVGSFEKFFAVMDGPATEDQARIFRQAEFSADELSRSLSVPEGSLAALCSIDLTDITAAGLSAEIDQLRLVEMGLFTDGFERGDVSAWSSSSP